MTCPTIFWHAIDFDVIVVFSNLMFELMLLFQALLYNVINATPSTMMTVMILLWMTMVMSKPINIWQNVPPVTLCVGKPTRMVSCLDFLSFVNIMQNKEMQLFLACCQV